MADGTEEMNDQVEILYMPCPDGHSMWGEGLPQELLVNIFSMAMDEEGVLFLCRAARLCRTWRNAARDSQLWRDVDLSHHQIKQFPRTLRWLAKNRLSMTTKLNLSSWGQLKLRDYKHLIDSCRQLQSLDLSYCNLTSFVIKALHFLPNLQDLNLSGTPNQIMVPTVLRPMLRSLGPRLRELNLSNNYIKGCDAIMNTLTVKCPNLTVLDLSSCTYSSCQISLNIEKLQQGCPKLRVLRLKDTKLPAVEADENVKLASPGFPDLVELNVAYWGYGSVRTYDDDFILRILKNSPHLRDLDLSMCLHISYNSLLAIPALRLKTLCVSRCSDGKICKGIMEIIDKWKHSLKSVDLSWNLVKLDKALELMGQHGTPVRSLNVAGTYVSKEAVRTVLTSCQQLTTLDVTACRDMPLDTRRCHKGREELEELLRTLS